MSFQSFPLLYFSKIISELNSTDLSKKNAPIAVARAKVEARLKTLRFKDVQIDILSREYEVIDDNTHEMTGFTLNSLADQQN